MTTEALKSLLTLSHEIGREDRGLALLGEGNTSARSGKDSFFVKASGTCLATLREVDAVECRLSTVLGLLDREEMSVAEVDEALLAARLDKRAKKPSVETVFHAYLLSLPGINFVGHSHATTVNKILCSPRAREFAENRMFPDEIVCCGVASVYIPLTDPGLPLAKAVRRETDAFIKRYDRMPRIVLMQNHGVIALGASASSTLAAMLMVEKAAKVFVGAVLLGAPNFLSQAAIAAIAGRPDEIYRQKLLDR